MRSQNQIVDRIRNQAKEDFFGFAFQALIPFVERDKRKREDLVSPEDDKQLEFHEPTDKNILRQMSDYLPDAYYRAASGKGISADRSVTKFAEWLWLLGDDEMYEFAIKDENYPMYGFPILNKIRDKYFPEVVVPREPLRL